MKYRTTMIDIFRAANRSDAAAITRFVNAAYRPASAQAGWTHMSDLVVGYRTTIGQNRTHLILFAVGL